MRRTALLAALATAAAVALAPIAVGGDEAVAAGCGGKATGQAFRHYGPVSESRCGFAGSPGARVYYSWKVGPAGGKACVDGWGFDEAHPKGRWFSLGCGERSIDYGTVKGVPWGNVLAMPKVRVFSQDSLRGVGVDWSH